MDLNNLPDAGPIDGNELTPVLQNGVWCKAPLYQVVYMATPLATAEPTAFVATAISDTQINLTWSGVGTFTLERNRDNDGAWVEIYSGVTASYNDTVLYGSEHYYYRLSAKDTGLQDSFKVLADATTLVTP